MKSSFKKYPINNTTCKGKLVSLWGRSVQRTCGIFNRIFLIFLLLFQLCPQAAFSQSSFDGEVDYLELAKLLIKDGNYARAERTLEKLKPEDDADPTEVTALQAMILLHKKKYPEAKDAFLKSLKLGQKKTEIFLYLAETQLHLKDLSSALKSLAKVGAEWQNKLPYYILKAEVLWQSGEKIKAWETLQAAEKRNLSKSILAKKKFQYYLQEQLYHPAYELAVQAFQRGILKQDILAMGSQLRLKQQNKLSSKLLQMALLKWPKDPSLTLELAQNYLALEERFSAALILEEASRFHPELNFEASELLRQTGQSYRTRHLNLLTLEPKKKLRQKVALFLESDDYQSLSSLLPELHREQMLQEEDIRYAVAFSLFQTGDFKRSRKHLNKIAGDDLFEKAVELKREIEKCQTEQWSCVETI